MLCCIKFVERLNAIRRYFGENNCCNSYIIYPLKALSLARTELHRFMQVLNDWLLLRTFLVGDSISMADIVLGSTLAGLFEKVYNHICFLIICICIYRLINTENSYICHKGFRFRMAQKIR